MNNNDNFTFPKVGISACALGQPVRYNGGHKQSKLCRVELSEFFDFHPFCPEVAIGLGVPREPIRLVQSDNKLGVGVVGTKQPELDVTDELWVYGESVAEEHPDLCGFVAMQGSPSCGSKPVKVYRDNGYPSDQGSRGVFIRGLRSRMPHIPVEESGRLNDPRLRENFVVRVMVYQAWMQILGPEVENVSRSRCIEFYAAHKYLLMSHHYQSYKNLGRLIANAGEYEPRVLAEKLLSALMAGLSQLSNRGSQANTLQHLYGYLKNHISQDEKRELLTLIEDYRKSVIPLIVPMTLLKHHFSKTDIPYINAQVYLNPHPHQLGLRNSI